MVMLTSFTVPTTLVRSIAALSMGIMTLLASTSHADEYRTAVGTATTLPAMTCPTQKATSTFTTADYDACKQTLDGYIVQYQQTGDNVKLYSAYKALAWLTYANYKHHMNSRTATKNVAWQNAHMLISQLAQTETIKADRTDIPPTSALMRPDLWAYVSALKDKGAIALTPREMAFAEVSLIWAASEQCARGWRQSSPHFRMATRYVMQANTAYRNHNPEDSTALSELIQRYYQAYLPLERKDDQCQGQLLPALS